MGGVRGALSSQTHAEGSQPSPQTRQATAGTGTRPRAPPRATQRRELTYLPPVFLPRKFHGQRSLAGYSPWGRKELP